MTGALMAFTMGFIVLKLLDKFAIAKDQKRQQKLKLEINKGGETTHPLAKIRVTFGHPPIAHREQRHEPDRHPG